ncbi:uncharacterized protein EV422DRAFT_612357 [Fimicolochytrium jonesii]|uniref:uncharacterized protein n=1 Tax=Fimicolochytrium jonesii TaxID=1396493 RepID=UPI0022FEBFDD|nr:uncharacterized protein EV422DRAFT_612357 [Fimicolochytrium jonesii]KAI8823777.1 hypothetical protein EV422DRAFT_612357 [Fimicolochytrium jonesii]
MFRPLQRNWLETTDAPPTALVTSNNTVHQGPISPVRRNPLNELKRGRDIIDYFSRLLASDAEEKLSKARQMADPGLPDTRFRDRLRTLQSQQIETLLDKAHAQSTKIEETAGRGEVRVRYLHQIKKQLLAALIETLTTSSYSRGQFFDVFGLVDNKKERAAQRNNQENIQKATALVVGEAHRRYGVSPSADDYHYVVAANVYAGNMAAAQDVVHFAFTKPRKPKHETICLLAIALAKNWDWEGTAKCWELLQRTEYQTEMLTEKTLRLGYIAAWKALVCSHLRSMDESALTGVLEKHGFKNVMELDSALINRTFTSDCLRALLRAFIEAQPGRLRYGLDVYRLLCSLNYDTVEDYEVTVLAFDSTRQAEEIYALERFARSRQYKDRLNDDADVKRRVEFAKKNRHQAFGKKYSRDIRDALDRQPPDVTRAYDLFVTAEAEGYALSPGAFSGLVFHCTSGNRQYEARKVFEASRRRNVTLPKSSYLKLIEVACDNGDWKQAYELIDDMLQDKGLAVAAADVGARMMSLAGKVTQGSVAQLESVREVYKQLIEKGVATSIRMVNVLASSIAKVGDFAAVEKLIGEHEGSVVTDEFTLHAVVLAATNAGRTEEARAYAERYWERGIKPFVSTVALLIEGSASLEEGKRLVERAEQKWGIHIPGNTARSSLAKIGTPRSLAHTKDRLLFTSRLTGKHATSGSAENDEEIKRRTMEIQERLAKSEVKEALALFDDMNAHPDFKPNQITYHVLIHHFARLNDLKKAESLLKDMDEAGITPTVHTYTSVVGAYARIGTDEDIENLLEEIQKRRVNLDAGFLNAIIKARVDQLDMKGARRWRRKLIKWKPDYATSRIRTNQLTYVLLMEGYGNVGTSRAKSSAIELLKAIESKSNIDPTSRIVDHVPYTTCIAALGKNGQLKEALQTWNRMLVRGITPVVETHNALLLAFYKAGDLKGAEQWFTHKQSFGAANAFEPDAITYMTLIRGHADADDAEGVARWVAAMKEAGIPPSIATHCILLTWMCRTSRDAQAREYYASMPTTGDVGEQAAHAVMLGFSQRTALPDGNTDAELDKWLETFMDSGVPLNVHASTLLLATYGKQGKFDDMRSVLEIMDETGMRPNEITFHVILNALAKAGKVTEMQSYIDEMISRGVPVQVGHVVCLMDAYVRTRNLEELEKCWQWLQEASWPGRPPHKVRKTAYFDPNLPGAAVSLYLDGLGLLSTADRVNDAWSAIQRSRKSTRTQLEDNEVCSYVEALVRLGHVTEAVDAVVWWKELKESRKLDKVDQKILRNLVGMVMQGEGAEKKVKVVLDRLEKHFREGELREVRELAKV